MAHPYDRTVAELMVDAANGLSYPASRADVVAWFAEHYPEVKASTIRAHIVGLTANDRSRHHYAWLAKRPGLGVGQTDAARRRWLDEFPELAASRFGRTLGENSESRAADDAIAVRLDEVFDTDAFREGAARFRRRFPELRAAWRAR